MTVAFLPDGCVRYDVPQPTNIFAVLWDFWNSWSCSCLKWDLTFKADRCCILAAQWHLWIFAFTFFFFFSWRVIALECCVGFCHTSTWISHICICLVAHLCLTFCSSMDCSPPGSSIHGISQARILEWVAILYSRGSSWPRYRTRVSCVSGIGRQIIHH